MKKTDFQKKNDKELVKDLRDKQESLRAFRFALSGSKTRNVREGRGLRADIARIKTQMSARLRK
ncbi:MAG: 50S ribosomal protein L29 [Candidatus Zambryskibacteria bacterium RIFCSPHIGHO2_01_FULL_43_27]|uniref:Large ribosomal subunit protein uL29 n=1 Tax=Candidatus Zambryskibacteria bacterium RIFCSPLOWO2_01_FULL_43_17 TaxID=1802760 RepID=A0A1G2U435_9BACT|nr:MAG: 50S ribosomal protein L29 [Candidatus Zambryskibacteria bacterium RIFCSPHIGHO2_01_FULL_43_27]OHB00023.1 MAG: 50S ribosomal protein L29 [Candidatus Zambryskibacteria bacterium RIFCSPHIGHO2_12_FULL_43_12b]OHB04255.1 MAG: 50S ribosomal protein L29 [Candidatus Zambryskibacteria bacterium RIFCSPLOWO2_01_FULL_43_17]